MRTSTQLRLAGEIEARKRRLESLIEQLLSHGGPFSSADADALKEAAIPGLTRVVDELVRDAHDRGHPWLPTTARRLVAAVREPVRPRIGRLGHYPPRPLEVPAHYLLDSPPDPAPTVSLVTPSYQQARYIDRAILSVAAQGYPALEYFVRDGGSTDGTVEVLRSHSALITDWASDPDNGQADAINRAFSETTGEIMAWLNSDDLLLPGALAYIARYFADHPEVDVLYGDRVIIDESDQRVGEWILPAHDDTVLCFEDFVPQETLFWRRTAWNAAGARVDPSFRYALDWDLLLRFREAGVRIVHVPRFLGAFRVHSMQKTTAEQSVGSDECAQLRRRVHGREVAIAEIEAAVAAYRMRHVLVHLRHGIRSRLGRAPMISAIPPRQVATGTSLLVQERDSL